MFDKYELGGGNHHHTHNKTVTEKRAPTDDSLKLLREMEKAARDSILYQIHLDDNDLKAVWTTFNAPAMMSRNQHAVCQVKLNGKEHSVEVVINTRDLQFRTNASKYVSDLFRETVSKIITNEILKTVFESPELAKALREIKR